MVFRWKDADGRARADFIRSHIGLPKMDRDDVERVFCLTPDGLEAIIGGVAGGEEWLKDMLVAAEIVALEPVAQ